MKVIAIKSTEDYKNIVPSERYLRGTKGEIKDYILIGKEVSAIVATTDGYIVVIPIKHLHVGHELSSRY